tara:strand:+ start:1798 stop:2190 length:393 start_codon:yes stop_codon:yes gene_type:complete
MALNIREINIYSGSYITGSNGQISSSIIAARWEVDPEDGKSLQLRVPAGTLTGQTEDAIPFYVSASGRIGIGTKNPEESIHIKAHDDKFKADWITSITCSSTNFIAYGSMSVANSISASSYLGPIDGGTY